MKNISFEYNNDRSEKLIFRTDHGMPVYLYILKGDIEVISLAGEHELYATDDNLHAIFVMYGQMPINLARILREARRQIDEILEEVEQEQNEEREIIQELSCPGETRRI